jgi:hypothetical protein
VVEKNLFSIPASFLKNTVQARSQWLTLVILVTWEAEIRRIAVQGQPEQIVLETPSPK